MLSLIDDADLHAPAHLHLEVDSVFRRLEHRGELIGRRLDAARSSVERFAIRLWRFDLLAVRAWELRHNLTIYDAAYVALAERIGAVLVTADRRLAAAPGLRCEVEVV